MTSVARDTLKLPNGRTLRLDFGATQTEISLPTRAPLCAVKGGGRPLCGPSEILGVGGTQL